MMEQDNIQWPREVNQKIIDHIFGKKIDPDVAERTGLLQKANNLYTKLVQKSLNEKGVNRPEAQSGVGQAGQPGAIQQQPVQASGQPMPEDGVLRGPKTLSSRVG